MVLLCTAGTPPQALAAERCVRSRLIDPGGASMPYYRLYHVRQSHFAGVDDFQAEDDVQAVRHAETLNGTSTAELWCGARKINTFLPSADSPTSEE